MWIRLLKSHTMNTGKKLSVGKVLNVKRLEAIKLIKDKTAEEYNGKFPPRKVKTEFFKPKIQDGNNRSSDRE